MIPKNRYVQLSVVEDGVRRDLEAVAEGVAVSDGDEVNGGNGEQGPVEVQRDREGAMRNEGIEESAEVPQGPSGEGHGAAPDRLDDAVAEAERDDVEGVPLLLGPVGRRRRDAEKVDGTDARLGKQGAYVRRLGDAQRASKIVPGATCNWG
jgi:hypothetical protein